MANPASSPDQRMDKKPDSEKPLIATKVTGTVKWFNVKSGYGFISRSDKQEDVFVHQTAIVKNNPQKWQRSVGDGETVEFDVVQGEKGFEAANVTGPNGAPVVGSSYASDRSWQRSAYRPRRGFRGGFRGNRGHPSYNSGSYSGGDDDYQGEYRGGRGGGRGFGGGPRGFRSPRGRGGTTFEPQYNGDVQYDDMQVSDRGKFSDNRRFRGSRYPGSGGNGYRRPSTFRRGGGRGGYRGGYNDGRDEDEGYRGGSGTYIEDNAEGGGYRGGYRGSRGGSRSNFRGGRNRGSGFGGDRVNRFSGNEQYGPDEGSRHND